VALLLYKVSRSCHGEKQIYEKGGGEKDRS
jgi:hypothetical protein